MRHLCIILFIFLFAIPSVAISEEPPSLLLEGDIQSLLAFKDDFQILINDQVTGGCLPQPSRLKDKMEIALRQNGFKISKTKEFQYFTNKVSLLAIGYKTDSDLCIAYFETTLLFPSEVTVPYADEIPSGNKTISTISYNIGRSVLSGPKHNMQSRLENTVKNHGEKIFRDISRAKDFVKEKFPEIKGP